MNEGKKEFLADSKLIIDSINKYLSKYYENEEFDVEFENTSDGAQEHDSYLGLLNKLNAAVNEVSYLDFPIQINSSIHYDEDNVRYYLEATGEQLHAGDSIEVLIEEDPFYPGPRWFASRIEYDPYKLHSHGWYIFGKSQLPLEGQLVRKRKYY